MLKKLMKMLGIIPSRKSHHEQIEGTSDPLRRGIARGRAELNDRITRHHATECAKWDMATNRQQSGSSPSDFSMEPSEYTSEFYRASSYVLGGTVEPVSTDDPDHYKNRADINDSACPRLPDQGPN